VACGVPADLVLSLETAHVDLAAALIRIDGREFLLEGPHRQFLGAHLAAGVDPTLPGMPDPRILYRGGADRASQQAQVGNVLGDLGDRAGVPQVTASRLNAWAARRAFDGAGGRIEVAAALLGVRSLDTAAARIGWDWR
jgi:integrase/recombinase XerC